MARPSRAADGAKPSSDKLRRLLGAAVTACALAVLAAGCAPDAAPPTWTPTSPPTTDLPAQTPSPTPTPTTDLPAQTPSATPTPTKAAPTTAYLKNVATASPELYQQAYDVYVQYFTYDASLQMDGGADELPPQLAAVLTGEALTEETQIHQQAKKAGLHWTGTPTLRTVKVAQMFDRVPVGTTIALQACEETSGAPLWDGNGREISDGSPVLVEHRYYMKYNNQHQLVIYDLAGGLERLQTCPF